MANYGHVTKDAVDLLTSGKVTDPREAWDTAVKKVFPNSESSVRKGCPRSTFLGLCENGLIVGAATGKYVKAIKGKKKNKEYGIRALKLLIPNSELVHEKNRLWIMVLDGEKKQHNGQMDVVISLWENNLIEWEKIS